MAALRSSRKAFLSIDLFIYAVYQYDVVRQLRTEYIYSWYHQSHPLDRIYCESFVTLADYREHAKRSIFRNLLPQVARLTISW